MRRSAHGVKPRRSNARKGAVRTSARPAANGNVAALFVALIHHPVLDRNGRIVTSAITSLDIHDIARSSHTYGVRIAYIVHPIPEQRDFAATVIDHWRFDFGRAFDGR